MTPRTESYSSLATLAACAEKYRLSYVERLEEPETIAQVNGSAMHAAMRVLYSEGWGGAAMNESFCSMCEGSGIIIRMGSDNMDMIEEDCRYCGEDPSTMSVALGALAEVYGSSRPQMSSKKPWLTLGFAEARLEAYVEERSRRPTMLEEAEVVAAFAEEMHVFDWKNDAGDVVSLRGMPDLVVRSGGKTFVVDHKFPTSGYLTDFYFLRFSLGMQLKIYAALYQTLTGEEVHGGFINAVSCGEKSADPPEKWKTRKSAPSALRRIDFTQEQISDAHAWAKGLLMQRDFHASVGLWPKAESACDDMGGCAFIGLCSAPSEGVRRALMMTGFRRKEEGR